MFIGKAPGFPSVDLTLVKTTQGWEASALGRSEAGCTQEEARGALIETLRDETYTLLTTLTHTLSREDRERKRILLGSIDVVASHIAPPALKPAMLIGKVKWCSSTDSYRFYSNEGVDFELDAGVLNPIVGEPVLAHVRREHPSGPGAGPVLSIERMFRSDLSPIVDQEV